MPVTTTSPQGRPYCVSSKAPFSPAISTRLKSRRLATVLRCAALPAARRWQRLALTKLVPGKTKITQAQCDAILIEVLAAEFEPAVVKKSPDTRTQNQMDAATSVAFNLGVGAMDWQWAKLWRDGKLKASAAYLGSHYNTAGGKKLEGLVRRRKDEARLFEHGIYTGVGVSPPEGVQRKATEVPVSAPDPVVKEAQELLTSAGLNPGAIDGWMGAKTKDAVIAYQKAHPHLVADGVIGPATLAQLRRDAGAAREAVAKASSTGIGSGLAAWSSGLPWGWIAGAAVIVALWLCCLSQPRSYPAPMEHAARQRGAGVMWLKIKGYAAFCGAALAFCRGRFSLGALDRQGQRKSSAGSGRGKSRETSEGYRG